MSKRKRVFLSKLEKLIVQLKFAIGWAEEDQIVPSYDGTQFQDLLYDIHTEAMKQTRQVEEQRAELCRLRTALEFMRAHYIPKKFTSELQEFERSLSSLIQ